MARHESLPDDPYARLVPEAINAIEDRSFRQQAAEAYFAARHLAEAMVGVTALVVQQRRTKNADRQAYMDHHNCIGLELAALRAYGFNIVGIDAGSPGTVLDRFLALGAINADMDALIRSKEWSEFGTELWTFVRLIGRRPSAAFSTRRVAARDRSPSDPKEQRIAFDDGEHAITLDGTRYQINTPAAYYIVKYLHSQGGVQNSNDIRENVSGVRGRNAVGDKLKTLPAPIRSCIHTEPGAGFFFRLPLRKSKKTDKSG